MNLKTKNQKFTKKHSFLSIYQPRENLNDPTFHYFTQPQPNYQKVSLHRKSARKQLTMYYQQIQPQHTIQENNTQKDNSTIIDFQYFNIGGNNQTEQTIIDKSKMVRESQWVRKYQPHKFIQLLSDDKINRNMLTWLKSWDSIVFNKPVVTTKQTPSIFNKNNNSSLNKFKITGQNNYIQNIFNNPKKLILLAGPPGCGKTTLMRVLAQHCKYQIVQINASDDRSANNLIGKIEDIAGNNTIRSNKKPALICLDQIDGVAEGEASGIAKLIQYIQTGKKTKKNEENTQKQQRQQPKQKNKPGITFTQNKQKQKQTNDKQQKKNYQNKNNTHLNSLNRPVVFICNDPFSKSLKQLRSKAHVIYFTQLDSDRIIKRMRQILQKQKIHIDQQVLQKICQICRNDVRGCIGVLQLVSRQKRLNNKNPKDIVNRMKLSFAKDNQSSINDFLQQVFAKKSQSTYDKKITISSNLNFIKHMQNQVMQIYNPSLLIQTFLQNFLNVQGINRKFKPLLKLYQQLVNSDVLIKNGFKYQNELQNYHLPYLCFAFNFGSEDNRKIQFPMLFFQRLRKLKFNKQLLAKIISNIPLQLRVFLRRQSVIGNYLLALYLSMQTSSTKQSQIIKSVSYMLSYGFTFKKQKQNNVNVPIFTPEIDTLLTYGQRKPQILITNSIKILMQENYQFFKDRKQMLVDNQLKDSTAQMVNQLNIFSRKKKNHEQGIKYRFAQGTGTKTIYSLNLSYFF